MFRQDQFKKERAQQADELEEEEEEEEVSLLLHLLLEPSLL
jgi:hypothetical protein